MDLLWRKGLRDSKNPRTVLVVLGISAGVFAVGLVFALSDTMRAQMARDTFAISPSHVQLWTSPFAIDAAQTLRQVPGVANVEAQGQWISLRWKLPGETEWRTANLVSRENLAEQHMDIVNLIAGQWAGPRTLNLERESLAEYGASVGDQVIVDRQGRDVSVPIVGAIRMPWGFFAPATISGRATFFASPETASWLMGLGEEQFNQINVMMQEYDRRDAERLTSELTERLEAQGIMVSSHTITDPGVHWLQPSADALFLILKVLGSSSLLLGALLTFNTVSAVVSQEVWQIGVMKVVGVTTERVMLFYLMTAVAYGVAALLPAVPMALIVADYLGRGLLRRMGIDAEGFQVSWNAMAVQAIVAACVPALSAAYPALAGSRITPHKAISSHGLGMGFGTSWLDRLAARAHFLPPRAALSLRNVLRRKTRSMLTLMSLLAGGVLFVAVMSVRAGLFDTLDLALSAYGFDVLVQFDEPQRAGRLVEYAAQSSGVRYAEVWDLRQAVLRKEGQEEPISVWGVPSNSAMFRPFVIKGRGLVQGDRHAILLDGEVAARLGITVGREVDVSIAGRESSWLVVGLTLGNRMQPHNFVPLDSLSAEAGSSGQGTILVAAVDNDAAASVLRETLSRHRLVPSAMRTADDFRRQFQEPFVAVVELLLLMALLAAVAGGIGLAGITSLNVVERRREIGVLRAVGARAAAVAGIFVGEGTCLGVASWVLACLVAWPAAWLFSRAVGVALFGVELAFRYPADGLLLWLAIVIGLSCAASLWPALRAAGLSVREALAYE